MAPEAQQEFGASLPPTGLVEALTAAYAALLQRQRAAAAAFVTWTTHARAHEFAWLDSAPEALMLKGEPVRVTPEQPIYAQLRKMMATVELNPYERELVYGFPYVVGSTGDQCTRAPLFTIPISLTADGTVVIIEATQERIQFNSLPYRSEHDAAAHALALERLIANTPEYPLTPTTLQKFCAAVTMELNITGDLPLANTLGRAPSRPNTATPLRIVNSAACFVAPKTSFFLTSDLSTIGKTGNNQIGTTALGALLTTHKPDHPSDHFDDARNVIFPFPSNARQRRVATLATDPASTIIVVQGPPGTGKSLTIANVVCHLTAKGKRVLVCSQKDKALAVVDQMLRELGLPHLPMTLLRQDTDSRRELQERLDRIQKQRSAIDTQRDHEKRTTAHGTNAALQDTIEAQLHASLGAEHTVERADRAFANTTTHLKRLAARWQRFRTGRTAQRDAPKRTNELGASATESRDCARKLAEQLLAVAAELLTSQATKGDRNQLKEFSKLLGKSPSNAKNYRVFERLKEDPAKCAMLLNILPCWIMSPDDVARLFPCTPGLFDTVIIDEASQCDLPSMTPVLYRAKQAIIAGDSKQMQAQRFAFTNTQVGNQAWKEQGLDKLDPDRQYDPAQVDLLQLASTRMDEDVFLDEHYRSRPPIIQFSNQRWYGNQLRIMRDTNDQRFGPPGAPILTLHHVTDGSVPNGGQENQAEARALLNVLKEKLEDPGYADATFGVICLYEGQMHLMSDLITEEIDEELRAAHDLVVVNPDGFQGDERDIIFYSLSYDANGMSKAALSARQADREHIQGMLNVAFTRAREELYIFHTAPLEDFGMESGRGTILDWLRHCRDTDQTTSPAATLPRAESEFEADVARELSTRGIATTAQYPSCGFFIDLVARQHDARLAIECDGEAWHLDEHGHLKLEDVWRQEILERAGWRVHRIPYRTWRKDRAAEIARLLAALAQEPQQPPSLLTPRVEDAAAPRLRLSSWERALVQELQAGTSEWQAVLKGTRKRLGYTRLGPRIRTNIESAINNLRKQKVLRVEEQELFLADEYRNL